MALSKLMKLVKDSLVESPDRDEESREEAIRLATAVVLLDVAYADESMSEQEESEVVGHLRDAFDLDDENARELLDLANEIRLETIDHWHMTNQIRNEVPFRDRMEIVRSMWKIVYADGHFHQYEGYLVGKLADLLGVEHRRMIDVKMSVRDELGIE